MISVRPDSTPRHPNTKQGSKTSHRLSRFSTSLAIQQNSKRNSKVKMKKQHKENFYFSETLPFTDLLISASKTGLKGFNSTKAVDLGSKKKQSLNQKKKNEILQLKLKDQQKEMELLKSQLLHLKSSLKQANDLHLNENVQLKTLNQGLQQKFQAQSHQIECLRKEMKVFKHDYSFNQNESTGHGFDSITNKIQISRRIQYVQHYEQGAGSSKRNQRVCHSCEQKNSQIQQIRIKYSNKLRSLQNQALSLKEKQLMSEVVEKQISSKNQCIDYLRNQLQIAQTNSNHLLSVIRALENKLQDVNSNKGSHWRRNDESFHSFGG